LVSKHKAAQAGFKTFICYLLLSIYGWNVDMYFNLSVWLNCSVKKWLMKIFSLF